MAEIYLPDINDNFRVDLNFDQASFAADVGKMRLLQNLFSNRGHRFKFDGEPWAVGIQSAGAESAVSIWLNEPWDGALGDYDAADVAGYQVRHSVNESSGLLVHRADEGKRPDRPQDIFIFVTGEIPTFRIHGWQFGAFAQQQCFWRTDIRHPAYIVPKRHLFKHTAQLPPAPPPRQKGNS